MIWLGQRLIDLGMWFRREPTAFPFAVIYGIGAGVLSAALILWFIRT